MSTEPGEIFVSDDAILTDYTFTGYMDPVQFTLSLPAETFEALTAAMQLCKEEGLGLQIKFAVKGAPRV